MLGCWVDEATDLSTKCKMIQVLFFFIIWCKILCKKPFNLFFCFSFFYNFTKMKIKSFECPKSIRNCEKNNTWNLRRLVDESFVPATQRIILKIEGFYKAEAVNWIIFFFHIKLSFSTKASQFETIFLLIWNLLNKLQIKWKIISNFVAFLKCPNFDI